MKPVKTQNRLSSPKRLNGKWQILLQKITRFYIQDINSKYLLNSVGIKNIIVTGDTRFDSVKMNKAKSYNNFIRLDMEDSSLTDKTIQLYNQLKKNNKNLGLVLQAYLYRTKNDLISLKDANNFNFRLFNGIYREKHDISIQDRNQININFLVLKPFHIWVLE